MSGNSAEVEAVYRIFVPSGDQFRMEKFWLIN